MMMRWSAMMLPYTATPLETHWEDSSALSPTAEKPAETRSPREALVFPLAIS